MLLHLVISISGRYGFSPSRLFFRLLRKDDLFRMFFVRTVCLLFDHLSHFPVPGIIGFQRFIDSIRFIRSIRRLKFIHTKRIIRLVRLIHTVRIIRLIRFILTVQIICFVRFVLTVQIIRLVTVFTPGKFRCGEIFIIIHIQNLLSEHSISFIR